MPKKKKEKKNTGIFSENNDKSALFICKRYEGGDSNRAIYIERPRLGSEICTVKYS